MIPTFVPKRFAMKVPWLVAAGLLLVTAAPALGATSAQQVYETPETGQTPSPLPNLPVPPAGEVPPITPFTPQTLPGPGPAAPGPLVAGSGAPGPTLPLRRGGWRCARDGLRLRYGHAGGRRGVRSGPG